MNIEVYQIEGNMAASWQSFISMAAESKLLRVGDPAIARY